MQRWDIINHLIEKNNYKSYLEIGYYKGWSFDNVKLRYKTAVDPNPSKTEYQEKLEYGKVDVTMIRDESYKKSQTCTHRVIKMTSDDFFKQLRADVEYGIVFIDGLHEASQVERDIQNSLKHLSEGGTIVLHDMLPPTLQHVTTGTAAGEWNGDCYKALLRFINEDLGREYTVRVVNTDWGCAIIQKDPNASKVFRGLLPKHGYKEAIEDFNYFLENKDKLFEIITPEEFLTLYSK